MLTKGLVLVSPTSNHEGPHLLLSPLGSNIFYMYDRWRQSLLNICDLLEDFFVCFVYFLSSHNIDLSFNHLELPNGRDYW